MIENPSPPVITIDGPSGTGKGTIGFLLANHLSWKFLDSGAIYRILAFAARQEGIALDSVADLFARAQSLVFSFSLSPKKSHLVFLGAQDCTDAIRSERCGQDASTIAAYPEIREALLIKQRTFAEWPGLVADGRDMGTVVFPDACIKFYLDASIEERAKRRFLQLKNQGNSDTLAQITEDLIQRDARDRERSHAPLKAAGDAIWIETTSRSVDEVFQEIQSIVDARTRTILSV